jgi:hypothetical protein
LLPVPHTSYLTPHLPNIKLKLWSTKPISGLFFEVGS